MVGFLATRCMDCRQHFPGEGRLPLKLLLSLPTVGLPTAVSLASVVTRLLNGQLPFYKVSHVPAWIVTSH